MTRDGMRQAIKYARAHLAETSFTSPFRATFATGDEDPEIYAEVARALAFTPARPT